MFTTLKKKIRSYTPETVLTWYHACNALLAAFFYGFPSKKLLVIGITGTKGKTSTSEFTWSVLTHGGGFKTGLIGTAHVYIGTNELPNTWHMTMPNPWYTQKMLRQMVSAGCTHAVLEVSSEGLKQRRNLGIDYDIGVFTNLSPEHLQSHNNSFEEYRNTKGRLFQYLARAKQKKGAPEKTGIFNTASDDASYFSSFLISKKIFYNLDTLIHEHAVDTEHNTFTMEGQTIHVQIPGTFNLENALAAFSIGRVCGINPANIKQGIEALSYIPGRMERIELGQKFTVFIDYAHEKLSMRSLLTTLTSMKKPGSSIILLFGAEGGGRDKAKRKDMGELAQAMADIVILSNVDPYDDDPQEILQDIARFVVSDTKIIGKNVFIIEDRREGIEKAFSLAKENDIVCICGKGAEKTMVLGKNTIPWDEQQIVRDVLKEFLVTESK